MAIRLHPSVYVHPGKWLAAEIVAPAKIKGGLTRLSAGLGVTRQALSALLNGRADLSAAMAVRFEKAFGIRADTLMRMQASYDLAQVRTHEDELVVERMAQAAWSIRHSLRILSRTRSIRQTGLTIRRAERRMGAEMPERGGVRRGGGPELRTGRGESPAPSKQEGTISVMAEQ